MQPITSEPRLLRKGWPFSKARERHVELATGLVAAGVEFWPIRPDDRPAIESLVNRRLEFDSPYKMDENAGGIRAVADGETIGAMVLEGIKVDGQGTVIRVTAVAVEPDWEGRGIGTVLLGMVQQVERSKVTYGGCTPEAARFYQRAGFDVLAPGEAVMLPIGDPRHLRSSNKHYPSFFIRSW